MSGLMQDELPSCTLEKEFGTQFYMSDMSLELRQIYGYFIPCLSQLSSLSAWNADFN